MIDPRSGLAPPEWQRSVGPVVLFRPDGKDISIKQVCCMHGFLDRLLDEFSEVAPGELLERMTLQQYTRFSTFFNEQHDENGNYKM